MQTQEQPATERHYTPQEVAEMWGVSRETVRKMFMDEDGVLHFSFSKTLRRSAAPKPRTSLRIPASVLSRVHQQWSRGSGAEIKSRRRLI
jgi:hypothetical protein